MLITSAQNSKIKLVNRLRGKRSRQQEARFAIDYERDLRRALRQGYRVDFILHCPEVAPLPDFGEVEAHQVSAALLKRASYRENPDGMIAVMRSKPAKGLSELRAADIDQALVLVALQVPGNIGALLRTADAAGIDAVILVDVALDLYNPNVIRSSTGACFRDNVYQFSSDEALTFLKREAFHIAAADVAGERSLYELDFRAKSAIVLGAEDRGLPRDWVEAADDVLRVPMDGTVSDSLNVSVCGALILYELYRQTSRDLRFTSQKG